MNKIVLRSLIVMLSLVFGLMVAGCNPEPEPEVDPSGGKTVEAKYWGTYIPNTNAATITLSEKKMVSTTSDGIQNEYQAWTDSENLFIVNPEAFIFGTFTSNTKLVRSGTNGNTFYTKEDD